eukprot:CAMPEP_0184664248 /NCGR_PEP_ID=MMETSP0308-20130426/51878_1 /TAXON_ID=38269 /ORGANISM="Gloeochaete witrockiana, Strain SAG 46.84" /LENGTH=108 /DNA_ID=CAMNT_0027107505 /DNA_START=383 /DNA_END=709 /DNA_ORIENTATION=-
MSFICIRTRHDLHDVTSRTVLRLTRSRSTCNGLPEWVDTTLRDERLNTRTSYLSTNLYPVPVPNDDTEAKLWGKNLEVVLGDMDGLIVVCIIVSIYRDWSIKRKLPLI